MARARAIAPEVEAGNVYLPGAANAEGTGYDPTQTPDWVRGLIEESAALPNAAHDDQVDALSQALVRLAGGGGGAAGAGSAGRRRWPGCGRWSSEIRSGASGPRPMPNLT